MDENRIEIEETSEGFTLLELLTSIKNNIVLLMVICIAFVTLGLLYTIYMVTPMYTSQIDMQIYIEHEQTTGTDSSKSQIAIQVANNIKEYIKFRDIIEPVLKNNNIDEKWETVSKRISSSSLGNSSAVRITYEDSDPKNASIIVTELARELARRINLEADQEESLKFATESINLINLPEVDPLKEPSSPNKILNLIISFLLGSIVGVVIVILKEQFSNKFTSKKEVETLLQLPVIAIIPSREEKGE